MELHYLDKVLAYLASKGGAIHPDELFAEQSLKDGSLMDALHVLETDGYAVQRSYVTAYSPPHWDVSVTAKGVLFHKQGGYTKEEKIKSSPLKELNISKWALGVAILSLIVAIIAILLSS